MHDESSDTTSGTDERKYLIDRREYLKATGATAAAVAAGATATGTAAAADYDTITVSSGNVRSFSLGDGETLENVLIDITADNAGYRINANGDGWAIRNVGVRGHYDADPDEPINLQCPNGGSGVVENVYLGHGGSNTTGIYVHAYHSGHIDMDNLNVQGWPDNGVYASGPGNHDDHPIPGGGGTIAITNSYGADNGIANFRLGTNGSYCENCVSIGGQRGYWGFYNETDVINCDIDSGIYASDGTWQDCAVVNVENTRFSGGTVTYADCAQVSGSSAGTPTDRTPDGVPTTPEEAASGSSGGDGGGDASEVAEDFSHNDIPGTYSFDTGAFTTTSTRSTSGSYSLRADDSANDDKMILREDMVTTAGNTYELDLYFPSDTDMGFMFGAQNTTGYSDYTGYSGFFESDTDEIRIDRLENGSISSTSATATTWPLDEWLTVELDYRDTDSSTITMTVYDAADQQVATVSLADTTYDSGNVGWYNWYATADWYADSWFAAGDDGGSGGTVVDDFEDGDLAEYAFDRGSSGASVVSSPTHSGSYALEYGETYTEAISTSGLNAYPSAGDTFSFWVRASGGADNINVTWGVQDHQNRYYAKLKPNAGEFYLFTYENGSGSDEDFQTGLSLSQDAWYEIEVEWQTDGTQIATLNDSGGTQLAQLSMTDATWTSGGVGYDAYLGSGEFVYFDDVTIQ